MRADTSKRLREFDITVLGNQKNIENAEELLKSDEDVLFVAPTNLEITTVNTRKVEKIPGVVFLTSQRFFFYYKIALSASYESVYLDEIRSVSSHSNGLSGGHIEISTITKTYDMLVSYKSDTARKIQSIFEEAKHDYMSAGSASSSPSFGNADVLAQLEKLASLKDKGIITEAEFNSKKADLLARL